MRESQVVIFLLAASVPVLMLICSEKPKQSVDKSYICNLGSLRTSDYPVEYFDRFNSPENTKQTYFVNPTTKIIKAICARQVDEPLNFYCEQATWDGLIDIEKTDQPLQPFQITLTTAPAPRAKASDD